MIKKTTKKYWHELSEEEFEKIYKEYTWGKAQEEYLQPDWCNYPEAIHPFGCWSLINKKLRKEISREFCKTCNYYFLLNKSQNNGTFVKLDD
jgi:hypothetical protein